MSAIVCAGTWATRARISSSDRRKLGGDHLSNLSDNSRTALSPRAWTSAMIASTVARVFASVSSCWPASPAVLMWRAIRLLLLDDLVGAGKDRLRHRETERFRGPK